MNSWIYVYSASALAQLHRLSLFTIQLEALPEHLGQQAGQRLAVRTLSRHAGNAEVIRGPADNDRDGPPQPP